MRVRIVHPGLAALATFACATATSVELTPGPGPEPAALTELWVEPEPGRDLFSGPGGQKLAPDPSARYQVIAIKRGGFSDGYTVQGPDEREWNVKFPPEAHSEITASRVLWGVGFHQPPIYLVSRWNAEGGTTPNPQLPARFREKKPDWHGLAERGEWSYYRNPFVGTAPLQGLLVLHAMLGNTDLKDAQNAIYSLTAPIEGASRWYVARDLGHTLGRPALSGSRAGDVEAFEKWRFIVGVENGIVRFDGNGGQHSALYRNITPADVVWMCERLERLSDTQWADAFRAGGYDREEALRFIRRLKQMIAAGLALKG